MKLAVLGQVHMACVGMLLCQGCLPKERLTTGGSVREKCVEIVTRSKDDRLRDLRNDPAFEIPFAVRLRDGRYLCAVETSKEVAAVLIAKQGEVLHIEPRVVWGPRGYPSPLVGRLRATSKYEQVVLCVQEGLMPDIVKLKILDWDGRCVSVRTVTRFTYGYVQGGKPYGIIPALLRVELDYDQILLLRKSADPGEPPEVAELVTWDEDTASFKVKRFQKVLVESQGRKRLKELIHSYQEAVEESSSGKDEASSKAPRRDASERCAGGGDSHDTHGVRTRQPRKDK